MSNNERRRYRKNKKFFSYWLDKHSVIKITKILVYNNVDIMNLMRRLRWRLKERGMLGYVYVKKEYVTTIVILSLEEVEILDNMLVGLSIYRSYIIDKTTDMEEMYINLSIGSVYRKSHI